MARQSTSSCFHRGLACAFVVLVFGWFAVGSSAVADETKFIVEVCENGARFQPDMEDGKPEPESDGLPAYGNEFITQGLVYPEGTLKDGVPSCPDESLAIGTWTCRGWHVADAATTTTGPLVITTQNFDLGDVPGQEMIVTDGFELADLNVPMTRPIVGGSGRFSKARGESVQTLLDFSGEPPGVKLRVEFDVQSMFSADDDDDDG